MRRHGKACQVGGVMQGGKAGVARIEAIGDVIRGFERARAAGNIGEQQRIGVDQY